MRTILYIFCAVVLLPASSGFPKAQDKTRQLTLETNSQTSQKRIALVIGNAAYTNAKPLANPTNDASDVAAALATLGFEVLSGTNLNKRQIETLIRQFGTRLAATKGTGLFYYAGHGLQVNGENYLVPVDAEILEADEVQYQAVLLNMVLSKMNSAGNDLNIVILDACRNNPFARSWRVYRDGGESDGLARVTPPQGTIVLYATQPGNVASDGTGRNGLFTESLLKQIKRPNVEFDQMVKNLTREVSERSNRKQFPWREGSSTGDFYFQRDSLSGVISQPNPEINKPLTAETLAQQALSAIKRGEVANAKKLASDSLRLNPNLPLAWAVRGWAKLGSLEVMEARPDLEKAVKLEPNNALFKSQLISLYRGLGENELAKKIASEVLSLLKQPATALDYYARGISNAVLTNEDEAIDNLTNAILLDQQFANAYLFRGLLYGHDRARYKESILDFTRAIEINPRFSLAYINRAYIYQKEDNKEKVILDFTKAIEINPQEPTGYAARGEFYGEEEEFDKAIADFTEAIKIAPKMPHLYLSRGGIYEKNAEYVKATADYTKLIDLLPQIPDGYKLRANVNEIIGRKDLAAADRKRAEELEKN